MTREVILDSETTGRAHQQGHRIISLGLVEIVDNRVTGREAEWFVNPHRPCDPGAYAVHRISDRWLAQQPDFRSVAQEVERFIGDDLIVAHYAAFDRGFVNMEFGRLYSTTTLTETEANRFPASQWDDSLRVARKRFPKQDNSLDGLADRFGVYRGHRIKHGALKDARILAEVWLALKRGEQSDLFAGEAVQSRLSQWTPPEIDYANRPIAPSRLTSAEVARWQETWGKDLGENSIWNDYAKPTAEK